MFDNSKGESKVQEITVLLDGQAGDGINQTGLLLARLFSSIGYYVYMYFDYPSLIRGGHNFAIIRASKKKVMCCDEDIDYLLAMNQDAVDFHRDKLKDKRNLIYDRDSVNTDGVGISLLEIIKEEGAKQIMRNSILIGAFARSIGVGFEHLENIMKKNISDDVELNLRLAKRGYESVGQLADTEILSDAEYTVLTGSEAISLGLIRAGIEVYIAYPMTPSSSILHFFAKISHRFNIRVIHPENEIAVMLMALGFSFGGKRVAVGTSGGGFCLMTEGLSLSGMAELPIVVIIGQRPGPSTGIPTYTAQSDLNFVLNAGHGEFVRFVVAPGDTEEPFFGQVLP